MGDGAHERFRAACCEVRLQMGLLRYIAGLEPYAAPTTERDPAESPSGASGEALTAILDELRAIRALLHVHVDNHTPEGEPPASQLASVIEDALPQVACPRPPTGERRYANGRAVTGGNPAEQQAFDAFLEAEGRPRSCVAALRKGVLDTPNKAP